MKKIAIIGAGISGLSLARILGSDYNITIFDKSRGVGGRVATRRASPYSFDHGAQFFTVRSKEFKSFLRPMLDLDVVTEWNARFAEFNKDTILRTIVWDNEHPHYVGNPNMNSIGKYLKEGLNIRLESKVAKTIFNNNTWSLFSDNNDSLGNFDWVVSTMPAMQSYDLFKGNVEFSNFLSKVKMKPCYSLMLGFDKVLPLDFDAALIKGKDISWIFVNSNKPGRSKDYCLMVHSTNDWADKNSNLDSKEVIDYMCNEVKFVLGFNVNNAVHKDVHFWRYANIGNQTGESYLLDEKRNIALCGDWFIQGRIEAAFLSANRLAKHLVKIL